MKYSEYLTYLATEGMRKEREYLSWLSSNPTCYLCHVIRRHSPEGCEEHVKRLRRTLKRKLAGRYVLWQFGSSSEERANWLLWLADINRKRGK